MALELRRRCILHPRSLIKFPRFLKKIDFLSHDPKYLLRNGCHVLKRRLCHWELTLLRRESYCDNLHTVRKHVFTTFYRIMFRRYYMHSDVCNRFKHIIVLPVEKGLIYVSEWVKRFVGITRVACVNMFLMRWKSTLKFFLQLGKVTLF